MNRLVDVGGQLIPDEYWTSAEPLLPCFIGYHSVIIPAGTKATCVPVDDITYKKWKRIQPSREYIGKHLAYSGGMMGFCAEGYPAV